MMKVIKKDTMTKFCATSAVYASIFCFSLPAMGETEATNTVNYDINESEAGELAVSNQFNTKNKRAGVSQYYYYVAEKPQFYSMSKLSRLSTALIQEKIDGFTASMGDSVSAFNISEFDKARQFLADFKLFALPEVADAIQTYYQQYPEFVWITDGKINEKAVQALEVLSSADDFGLNPSDYQVILHSHDSKPHVLEPSLRVHIEFEMVLSSKLLTYILDGTRGRINPNKLSRYHDIPRKKVGLVSELSNLASTDDVQKFLVGVHPDNQQFKSLVRELKELRLSNPNQAQRVKFKVPESIRPGDSSEELPKIIAAIHQSLSLGSVTRNVNTLRSYEGTTKYTSDLVLLVRDFQAEKNLEVDGIIGKRTVHALDKALSSEKIDKVRFAMERLRWLPDEFGSRHVFVNQPAFEAEYWEEDREKLSMRVVIGSQWSQTSFFHDEIERVVYNPYWSVPTTILRNEYAQKFIDDPTYFDRMGFEALSKSGSLIPPTSIDWKSVVANKKMVRVRQTPGKNNSLGELKIMFPNVHAIYMHDTIEKHLFEEEVRTFSHGCVRLQQPREMAAAILGVDTEYVAEKINENKNRSESIDGKIPIYISYFTAWPGEDGEISYFEDVYERDDHLRFAELNTNTVRQIN